VRFSPRSIFLGVVALGLPFAVTVGWTIGAPSPVPPSVSAPGGLGGIGTAPSRATTAATSPVGDWSPRAPRPVSVESTLPGLPLTTGTAPSGAVPSAVVSSGSPDPTLTLLPPVPTPTSVLTTPPSPSATVPSESAEPESPGLNAARLVRRS
jgi:hypothetical protein